MKLNLKMIAVAAAMVAAGSVHAAPIGQGSGDSSLIVYAFNAVTNAYYARDLGFTLNSFLPSSVTTLAGDGGVTGNKTPEAGLTLNAGNTASFADASFSAWLAGQTASDIRWSVFAGDNKTSGTGGVSRVLVASSIDLNPATAALAVSNGTVRNGVNNAGGVQGLMTLGFTGFNVTGANLGAIPLLQNNSINNAASLSLLGAASNLYYFAATTQTLSAGVNANAVEFGNSAGFATVSLAANGDFTYSLAPAGVVSAVPVPAAAWLLGSGLVGIGGMIRRRKAAAQA